MHSRVPSEPVGAVTSEVTDAPPDLPKPDLLMADVPPSATAEPVGEPAAAGKAAVDASEPGTRRRPAPRRTLWEQGRHPGRLVLRATTLLLLAAVGLNHLATGTLGVPFDVAFVASCVLIALWVRPTDFFMVGVYPPLLLGAVVVALGVADPAAVARADDPAGQAIVSGLAHHAQALVAGYALTLGILALRQVALRNAGRIRLR